MPLTPLFTVAQRARALARVRCRNRRAPRQSGAAAVEFALLLPFLLLLLTGMVEASLMLYDQAIITNASREGARAGIVLRQPKLSTAEIEAVALNYSINALVSLGAAAAPTVTVEQAADPVFATPLRVTVNFQFTGFGFVGLLTTLTGPVNLSATSVMQHE